ncbi:MAG: hypothetical protein VW378_00535 [bacterium]
MIKQNKKILLGLLATALLSTQAQAGFLNFNGEHEARITSLKIGSLDSTVSIQQSLKLNGSKRLPDGFKVNYEIGTGSDRRSTWASTTKTTQIPVNINELNIEWKAAPGLQVTLGRAALPFTSYSTVLFDPDLKLDILGGSYTTKITPQADFSINVAYSVLDEYQTVGSSTTKGEKFFGIQPQVSYEISPTIKAEGYVAIYQTLDGDTAAEANKLESTVFGIKGDFASPGVNNVSVYAEMNENGKATTKGKSQAIGVVVGDKKVQGLGSWNARIESRKVEANSFGTPNDASTKLSFEDDTAFITGSAYEGIKVAAETGLTKKTNAYLVYQSYESDPKVDASKEESIRFGLRTNF